MPFYRDSGRLKPLFRADGAFDMAGWNDVPILTRNEAKANEDALQARVTRINQMISGPYGPSGVKTAMNLGGFKGGIPRRPLLPLTAAQVEGMRQVLMDEGLLP